MKDIELLAPARDLECGVAAIDCGADAVYIGGVKFGARESAGNGLDDVARLAEYAHKYWARTYVTVNTLLYDREVPQAVELIHQLYDIGVDGVIIQDVGLLECDLPPIPIIASTQMHNNTPEKAAFLEKVGIKRIILARELDISQIKAIRERSGVELEVFVHGALCVSYSGQCYLSYVLGGRSGNRGQCAQPCRKLYDLVDENGKTLVKRQHLLSLKDLNLSEHLRELVRAGVSSFKIEGRLKDRAYVSNIVAYYRARLDEVLAEEGLTKSSSGTSYIDFAPEPGKTFNRGYTTYFLYGKGERIGSIRTPKMVGEEIGRITQVSKRAVEIDSSVPLHSGDGICFFDKKGELRGTVVNGVQGRTILPDKLDGMMPGIVLYRNHDHEFLTRLNKSRPRRLIGITMQLSETADGFLLTAVDEDGNSAEFSMPCEKTPAQKADQALGNIRKQLEKAGGTEFECTSVDVDMEKAYFLPISVLNALRRGVLEQLTAVRSERRPRETGGILRNDAPYPERELSFTGNVLNRHADDFYRRHGVISIQPAAESGLDLRGRKVMTTRYCVKHQLGLCGKPGGLSLVDEEGRRLLLTFDCEKCEMHVHLANRR